MFTEMNVLGLRALAFAGLLAFSLRAQSDINAKIRAEGLQHSQAASVFETLTINIGPRLTNSPAFRRAVDFVKDRMTAYGLANVHLEPWKFGRGWTLEKLTLEMIEPRYAPLIGYAEGWSPSTNGDVVGMPVYLGGKTAEEIQELKPRMKGAIVMTQGIQTAFVREDRPQPTAAGTPAIQVLSPPPLFAEGSRGGQGNTAMVREAGAGVMLRPNVLADGTVYVTGRDQGAQGVPSIVMSSEQYNMIARMIDHNIPVKLRVNVQGKFYEDNLNADNIIGEIPGSDPLLKQQVVMLGAHVDSWHTAVGATDNADGVTTMLEAMRILKAVGAKPRRTIRVAIWSGEEQGLLGSRAWVARHITGDANKTEKDNLSVYFNIDNGTGPIYGFALEGILAAKPILDTWLDGLTDLGTRKNVNLTLTSTDHQTFLSAGIPGFNPFQDYEGYDVRTHHTNMDVADHVKIEDIHQAAVVMATFAYNAAMMDEKFPRPAPQQAGAR